MKTEGLKTVRVFVGGRAIKGGKAVGFLPIGQLQAVGGVVMETIVIATDRPSPNSIHHYFATCLPSREKIIVQEISDPLGHVQ